MPRAATSKGTKPDISFQSELVVYSNDICLPSANVERRLDFYSGAADSCECVLERKGKERDEE